MIDREQLRDRYRGVMLGSAVGDALGATVEFMSREQIRDAFRVHREIVGGGWLRLPAGEVTDDTQMARCIARSLAEQRYFDPADIAIRFVEWYHSNPPDIGNTTRDALRRLAAGVPWDEAGALTHIARRPDDASNGSLMRTHPVALFARTDPVANAQHSRDASRITHANPLCTDTCVAFNIALAGLLDAPNADILSLAISATDNSDVRSALLAVPQQRADTLKAGGWVLATLQSAFWAVLRHSSLEDAIVAAVNLGDDADTTGAVAGALAGARWGLEAIPQRWLDTLRGRDELLQLADALLALSLDDTG